MVVFGTVTIAGETSDRTQTNMLGARKSIKTGNAILP
jgi:hypothetical protein